LFIDPACVIDGALSGQNLFFVNASLSHQSIDPTSTMNYVLTPLRQRTTSVTQQLKTTRARKNKYPPSSITTMPSFVRCDAIAPAIKPTPNRAPRGVVRGINNRMEATSSRQPVPILPTGSMPNVEKMYTDSGAAVNLKYNV